ncbi:MAG: SRPBCC family protein [Myxococcota bacterium]
MTYPTQHISVSIQCPAAEVYDFASNPANLPRWAAGLGASIRKNGEEWVAASPMGEVKVRFVARNAYGVLDHDVTLPSGETVNNPMRVIPNGAGCDVVFTLRRRPGMTEEEYAADAQAVKRDLEKLKQLFEISR